MALTYEAYRDLVQGLREHPEWRAELRPLVLGEEILSIPERMGRLESRMASTESGVAALVESIDRLEAQTARNADAIAALEVQTGKNAEAILALEVQTSKNTEAIDRLITAVETLNGRITSVDGRLGNLEGWRLEERYFRYIYDWFDEYIGEPSRVFPFQLPPVRAAMKSGQLLAGDRQRLRSTDIFVTGLDETAASVVLAGEISATINTVDIEGAERSADILRALGIHARGFVGGYAISDAANELVKDFGTLVDLRRPKG